MGGLGLSSFWKQQGGVGGADLRFFLPLWGQLRKVLETLCKHREGRDHLTCLAHC